MAAPAEACGVRGVAVRHAGAVPSARQGGQLGLEHCSAVTAGTATRSLHCIIAGSGAIVRRLDSSRVFLSNGWCSFSPFSLLPHPPSALLCRSQAWEDAEADAIMQTSEAVVKSVRSLRMAYGLQPRQR